MTELAAVKERLVAEIDKRAEVLIDASHQIHANPELCYEERFAHDLLTSILETEKIDVERHAFDLETAFIARAGTGDGPTIAVLCEYDALPGIGHACGHNIIGTAGLGAGIAAATLASELGCRIVVLGTPAEEGGGGKELLIQRGALEGVDAAMMVHPAGADLARMDVIAIHQMKVHYHGQAAHAAAFPHKGRNALDAAVLGYMNVAALRQHIKPNERIHGIFTHAGDKPNIVPSSTEAEWYVRSPTLKTLDKLKPRVVACLEAGAQASGCEMEIEWQDPAYADMVDNRAMLELYIENAKATGRTLIESTEGGPQVVGSTDMGNVSYVVPSIHPMIKVAPGHLSIHTPEFAEYTASADGDNAVIDGAKTMAMTVADLWMRPDVLAAAKDEFTRSVAERTR